MAETSLTPPGVNPASLVQGTREWYEARVGRVTSSCFGKVMTKPRSGGGLSKTALSYMMEVFGERLTGSPADEINSKYLDWGNKHEPTARGMYCWRVGLPVQQTGFVLHPTLKGVGGSPDGLVGDEGVMEIKCPYTVRNHLDWISSNAITDKDYQWQVQGNMWVTERQWLDFVSFHPLVPKHLQLHVIRVHRDQDMIDQLEDRIPQFLEQIEVKIKKINANVTGSDWDKEQKGDG